MRPDLTQAQRDWMAAHPHYCFPGRPKPGVSYKECGTLYADGRFDPMESMKPVRLEEGCILVGVPNDLYFMLIRLTHTASNASVSSLGDPAL